jgi:class 3 adenylate cyclase
MSAPSRIWQITEKEMVVVDAFRLGQRTSVLTIMFTDIKGFTQTTERKGDDHSNKLRKLHDDLLTEAIESGGAGKIIKHIGDSVMAVFAEPAMAAARSLQIQNKIQELHVQQPELKDIQVRIGLHMGQVTVDDKMSLDVFGRHVNRAARVESLADGGQIFLTYAVYDSAQSWLVTQKKEEASCVLHGRYYLKGIPEPVEIFQLYNPLFTKPRPPQEAKKVRFWPKVTAAAILVLMGVLGTLALIYVQRSSVTFEHLEVRTDLLLDHSKKLTIDGDPDQRWRKCLTRIPQGKHLLHYDVSYITRYYAPIEVRWGANHIKPRFEYCGMPGTSQSVKYEPTNNEFSFTNDFTYVTFSNNQRKQNNATLVYSLNAKPMKEGQLQWNFAWNLTLNGKVVSKDTLSADHLVGATDPTAGKKILFEDERHYYFAKYRLEREFCQFEISSAYIEYK